MKLLDFVISTFIIFCILMVVFGGGLKININDNNYNISIGGK